MNHAPIVPIVLPALAAALMLLDRRLGAQRALAWLSVLMQLGCAAWLVALASDGWRGVYLLGNWAAPWGIVLVCDRLSAMMVALVSLLAVIALAAAHGRWDGRGEHFHPLLQVQLMGLNGAFLTGDVFNLFVFFEVLLIASYGLLVHGDGAARIAAGLRYVTLNLLGSALFLIGASLLYGVTGTLNMADLSARMPELAGGDATLALIGAWLLLVVFGLKAAALPLYLWLPGTYSAASPPVAALFAVMTKVGVYAVLRTFTLVFGADAGPLANAVFPWLAAIGAGGYALAMLGALAGTDLRRLAAMMLIGSAGFLLVGVGLATPGSVAAALFYLPHTTLSAAALYLVADLVARGRGDAADRLRVGPAPLRPAATGLLFFATAVAIAGLPPFGGFVGKAMLLAAMLPEGGSMPGGSVAALWTVILGGSLLAMIALARAGSVLFWKSAAPPVRGAPAPRALEFVPALVALVAVVAVTVWAAPLQRYADAAARDLLEPSATVDQVLRTVPRAGPHQPHPESYR
ncbi:MAG: monovalent cation/H+ antiporter subunit D [Burkholderiales bacterium]|jgi:multicomponent K+:H+ antiporter subunit D